jgi:TPR repeat protein
MKNLTATIRLTIAVLLGSTGTSWGADFDKGLAAAQSGDFATALREFRPLAEQGNAYGQFLLGGLYLMGQGVPQDYVYMWLHIAATSGLKKAPKFRDIVSKEMTPAQIEKAEKLASECVAKKYKGC